MKQGFVLPFDLLHFPMAGNTDRVVRISVNHSPILKLKGLAQNGEVEIPAGSTVQALLGRLGVPDTQQRYLLVYVNGGKQTLSYTLRQADALQLFLPIGGG
jgi:sulfur carrier protein ThiS